MPIPWAAVIQQPGPLQALAPDALEFTEHPYPAELARALRKTEAEVRHALAECLELVQHIPEDRIIESAVRGALYGRHYELVKKLTNAPVLASAPLLLEICIQISNVDMAIWLLQRMRSLGISDLDWTAYDMRQELTPTAEQQYIRDAIQDYRNT